MKVIAVVGARPNFIKIAAVMSELRRRPAIQSLLVHTGQHYDRLMSEQFFHELAIPKPDIDLGIGPGTHAVQTAHIMVQFEKVLLQQRPHLVIVVGDVNSTLACALTAAKLQIPVAHIEAGLRSFDRSMPEEINRLLTDAISDFLFTTEPSANENLRREGIPEQKIHFVGNVMIDTLLTHRTAAERSEILQRLHLQAGDQRSTIPYAVLTLHRPGNVDDPEGLHNILSAIGRAVKGMPIIFPCHPRTRKQIAAHGLDAVVQDGAASECRSGLRVTDPLGYLDFLHLMSRSTFVLTDSGGIQEETTVLGIPCLTLRNNTERPVTVTEGTNHLAGTTPHRIEDAIRAVLTDPKRPASIPALWDGHAAKRIIEILLRHAAGSQDQPISTVEALPRTAP